MRATAATAVGLLLVSLVALASGGSPWHAGGRQDVPVGVIPALAAAAGALVVGSLLLAWVGTPSVEKRLGRKRRLGAKDAEEVGVAAGCRESRCDRRRCDWRVPAPPPAAPRSQYGETPPGATPGNAVTRGDASSSALAGSTTSSALTWLVVGSAAALLLLAPAAVFRPSSARAARP